MANINLAANDNLERAKAESFAKGISLISAFLLLSLAVYGGLAFLNGSAAKKISSVKEEYQLEYAKLSDPKNLAIVDFQSRINAAEELLERRNSGYLSVAEIEKTIVQGIYLKSFSFSKSDSIELEGIASNFETLAKQILSFKKSDFFSSVEVGKTGLDDKGGVAFALSLKINK